MRQIDPSFERALTKAEIQKIKSAFRPYDGRIDHKIKEIFKDYELDYKIANSGHWNIYRQGCSSPPMVMSASPSHNCGEVIACTFINYVQKNPKKEND